MWLLWLLLTCVVWAQPTLRVAGDWVEIRCSDKFQVWRSTSPQDGPTSHWRVAGSSYRDAALAHGIPYYYEVASGGQRWRLGPVRLPWKPLPPSRRPRLLVDKSRYLLSVLEGQKVLKSYAVAMGSRPMTRKLQVDRASTPEGRYRILNLQPQATYHRALDVDYPNETDIARHQLLAPQADIGGEIQIHGMGIERNWTWGCIALRNLDVDELFRHQEIVVGTELWIYGGEVSLTDLESDARAGAVDRLALGRRQQSLGLPVTCLAATPAYVRKRSGSSQPTAEKRRPLRR
ncbi:hypothetical protein ABS71_15020 [bacterium SCN 62-11]|nr:L,D-transpeptidase [Candidatus Eremiobacteraeota bacterium]ODT62930.1 MAG: hypothetical protein ABS71_15020 [bacterium SCN 62-11]